MYKVIITPEATEQITRLNDSGEDSEIKKLKELLAELAQHPEEGTGKPENFGDGEWSRHLNEKNRLVYHIDNYRKIVKIMQVLGHYNDH